MLFYFFIFMIIGFLLYKFFNKKGAIAIIIISILWGISSAAVWGLASFVEMFLGFYIAQVLKK
jgi:hypothetical protein